MRDHVSALRVALRTPGVVATELESLLKATGEPLSPHATRDITRVQRQAHTALSWLSRLSRAWGTPWRNTCLFRSVTECLVLRAHGYGARVVIGVARDLDRSGGGDVHAGRSVIAHAWVECDGFACACGEGERTFSPLLSATVSA